MGISQKRAAAIVAVMSAEGVLASDASCDGVRNILVNVFDAHELATCVDVEQYRRLQIARVCEEVATWMKTVYMQAPNIQDGNSMKLEILAGADGWHEKADYQFFTFNITPTGPTSQV